MEKQTGRFGTDPLAFFEMVYTQEAPWEIGSIQPDLLALLERRPPAEPVLDIGCATGDAVFDLARRGYRVVGVDFVASAIAKARERTLRELSAAEGARVEFLVGDALRLPELGRQFGSVVDSGFLHLLDDAQAVEYLRSLGSVLSTGARGYFIEFAVEFGMPNTPRTVDRVSLESWLDQDQWRIAEFADATFRNKINPVPASLFCLERL